MAARWFFALQPEGLTSHTGVQRVLGRLRRSADERDWEVRWTAKEHLHVTVGFVGEVEEARHPLLHEIGQSVSSETHSFPLELKNVDAFPEISAGRVVWVGVRRTQALLHLHEVMASQLMAAGFPLDREEFVPHLTLGRLRNSRQLTDWLSPFRRQGFGKLPVHSLLLLTSEIFGSRVVHQVVGQWALQSTESAASEV